MTYTIYLAEDEESLNSVLKSYLEKEGYNVTSFLNGNDAIVSIDEKPDLWILDIMMPLADGYEVIKNIKSKTPDIPVIFISARDADLDRIVGLEMGSDDYISKPFMPKELVIRVKKLLNRIYEKGNYSPKIHLGKYYLSETDRTVFSTEGEIEVTSKEFDLLLTFAKNKKRAFSRDNLLNEVWGSDYFGSDRVVDDLIRRLRKKMPEVKIETIYGYGYKFSE